MLDAVTPTQVLGTHLITDITYIRTCMLCDQSGVEGAARGGGDHAAFRGLCEFPFLNTTQEQVENND